MNTSTWCTDFNNPLVTMSGEYYNTFSISINVAFSIVFSAGNWLTALGAGFGNLGWSVVSRISTILRTDGYLNTSPVAVSLPIIYKQTNIRHTHVVQMSDFDGSDILQCRWSTSSGNVNGADECSGICNGLPGGVTAILTGSNCTMSFTLTTDYWYYGVALQIEDFYDNVALLANSPMSSVPMQFLFYGYPNTSGCSTPPEIIGDRPNRACIGVMPGTSITLHVVVDVYCSGKSIVDFISTVPRGVTKSSITSPTTGQYIIYLYWTPRTDQYGPQGIFQGSASPIGTVFQNQTLFSIQTSKFVNRPTRNGTFIYLNSTGGGTLVQKYDCGWDPNVTYTGYTIVINFPVAPWTPGHFFYVTMDGGVASGTEFCGPESDSIYDPTFWCHQQPQHRLPITVTTKPTSTTSINTLLTTTGIVITTTSPVTTTATTASTTIVSTTAGSTQSTTTTESAFLAISPKDFTTYCIDDKSYIYCNDVSSRAAMYAAFTKVNKMFNPSHIQAKTRHRQRMKRIMGS
ncbi:hypothetical protein I4U23_011522 [Adineta vaga]|nr:hypothetical protein I4U23_011522 [Adineta vaga]